MRKQKKKKPIDATNSLVQNGNGFAYKNRLKPKTINQNEFIRTIAENTITFCQGVAGSRQGAQGPSWESRGGCW